MRDKRERRMIQREDKEMQKRGYVLGAIKAGESC